MGGYAAASSNNNWPYYTQLLLNVKSKGWGLGLGVLFGDTVLEIGIVRPCPSGSSKFGKKHSGFKNSKFKSTGLLEALRRCKAHSCFYFRLYDLYLGT